LNKASATATSIAIAIAPCNWQLLSNWSGKLLSECLALGCTRSSSKFGGEQRDNIPLDKKEDKCW